MPSSAQKNPLSRSPRWATGLLGLLGLLAGVTGRAADDLPAFPGASGPGAYASGGRKGSVYHVTNLAADGPGSFADAVGAGNRIIVFDVAGVIELAPRARGPQGWLRCNSSDLTIAGESAPWPGVTIKNHGVKFTGRNVIIRNLKFRPGQDPVMPGKSYTNDGLSNYLQDSLLDHLSISWADDEGLSTTDKAANNTVQYCLVAEGLSAEGHSYGGIIASKVQGAELSYHHNIFAHHATRLPRIGSEGGRTAKLSFVNNLVYNWISVAGYSANDRDSGLPQASETDFLGNYYLGGPDTISSAVAFRAAENKGGNGRTGIYARDNVIDLNGKAGLIGDAGSLPQDLIYTGDVTWSPAPHTAHAIPTVGTRGLPAYLLKSAGAFWWQRDLIDDRIVAGIANRTGGIIKVPSEVGGWDQTSYRHPPDYDQDNDGMEDSWERLHGLNPAENDALADHDQDGYTNIENFLQDRAAFPAPAELRWEGGASGRFEIPENWATHWRPSRHDTVKVDAGRALVASDGQQAGTLRFGNPAGGAGIEVLSGWLYLADNLVLDGQNQSFVQSGGTVLIRGTCLLKAGQFVLQGGTFGASRFCSLKPLTLAGGTFHAVQFEGDIDVNGATVTAGWSDLQDEINAYFDASRPRGHEVTVNGNLTMTRGTFRVKSKGAAPADFWTVNGEARLGGHLEVRSVGESTDPTPMRQAVLKARRISGRFSSVTDGFNYEIENDTLVISRK